MNLARIGPRAALGAALGGLAAFLCVQLGLFYLIGNYEEAAFTLLAALVGAAFACVADRSRWIPRLATLAIGLLAAAYVAIAWTPLARVLAERWVRSDSLGSPGAVVVLSAGVLTNGAIDAEATARLLSGAELARTRSIRLVTTRVNANGLSTDDDQRQLISQMAPNVPWTIVSSAMNTHDEAIGSARVLLPLGVANVAVVTSPMHTRRACGVFEGAGFHVTCVPALERARDTWHPRLADDRLATFRAYIYERIGWIKYRMKGWIH